MEAILTFYIPVVILLVGVYFLLAESAFYSKLRLKKIKMFGSEIYLLSLLKIFALPLLFLAIGEYLELNKVVGAYIRTILLSMLLLFLSEKVNRIDTFTKFNIEYYKDTKTDVRHVVYYTILLFLIGTFIHLDSILFEYFRFIPFAALLHPYFDSSFKERANICASKIHLARQDEYYKNQYFSQFGNYFELKSREVYSVEAPDDLKEELRTMLNSLDKKVKELEQLDRNINVYVGKDKIMDGAVGK